MTDGSHEVSEGSLEARRAAAMSWYQHAADDIYDLVYARRWWFRLGDVIEHNDDLPKEDNFYAVLGDWYAKYLSVGIRRHVDRDRRTYSLRRLLEQIAREPDLVLSPVEYRDRYPDFMRHVAEPDPQERLPDGWADALVKELVAAAEPAKAYVDKHVAHLDRVESPATYAELHGALDVIVEALLSVKFALTGSAPTAESFNQAAEQFDWARVFRTAWITDTTWPKVMDT